ncbi:hypothetical protein HN385_00275 [archaeon]|mgnify:CR=1 FL=1|jgi:ubiquitin-small subunit ribosomal protein S27Ae|nr:hypothetical protein [archaeon]MBT3451641.1 hypothetical protein [archaeon]MBT6869662.1 hypothetical protein [archaeon]MBT7192430.1 hypothetical protein [archaeon]MBT7380231.1 hypothetical protein [archaeon]
MAKKGGKGASKGKDKKSAAADKKKGTRKLYQLYDISGDKIVRKNQYSPKSPGDFLANHKERKTCGKTGYTEFSSKKKEEVVQEEKKEE